MNPSAKTYKSLPHRWIERFSWQDSTNRAPGLLCFKTTKCITNWSYALHNQKINNYNNLGRVSLTFWNSDYSSQHTTQMFFPPSNSGHWCFFIGSGKQRFFFSPGQWRRIVDLCFWQVSSFCIECCPWLHLGVQGPVRFFVSHLADCILQLSEVKPWWLIYSLYDSICEYRFRW